ncbi:serine hydrolase domain-containing protein [Salinimicrobium oceani]|uniref:Beta-lactamase family protein n=1 Tax=Salinimicrobium oceani TaxID=2722702 RepID=A0ABX1CYF9_9FLAO|nr:serine hydrolase domain-containing protein [Salinimicrobium oceani]NJW52424.1 beta-lactamase family protein [Salinimicrobium oceani]
MSKRRFKQILRIVLPVATLISLFFVPWVLLWAWISPLPDTVQEQMNKGIALGFDGMIVYVEKQGKAPEYYAAGLKNKEDSIPASPHSLFKIASIGKLYDAVAIAKLVNDQRLSLDKNLAEYFPLLVGRIANAEEITLRMLVQHQSGIPNFTNTPNFWTDLPKDNEDALQRVLDMPANFEPGSDYEYSNTNYLLIQKIIEQELGYSEFQYIEEEILTPLGLKNTYSSIHDVAMEDVMSGYYVGVEEDIKSVDYGSMLATAEDVGKFLRALNDGSLFQENELDIYRSLYKFEHTGLIPGYQSIARYHPDIDTVVIQFVNTTNFDGYHWQLSEIIYNKIVKILKRNSSD